MNFFNNTTYIKDLSTAIAHSVGIRKLKGSSVLVTGATGTIGSFLVDLLLHFDQVEDAGIKIYAAARNTAKLKEKYASASTDKIISLDYDMVCPIKFDIEVDYFIHAAGNAYPAAFNEDPVGTIMGNVLGTYNLLEYAHTHGGKKFLYISSGEVYGQGDLNFSEFEEIYAGYIDSISPRSCYPISKRTVENLCSSYYKQYGLQTVIVRPCHTFGPEITELDNRASVQFIRNALCKEDILVKSSGNQLRSYNYVADCASAILTVLVNGDVGEAYNIVNPYSNVTIAELAGIIASIIGRKVVFADPDTEDIANKTPITKQVLSSKKIEALGWLPAFSIETGIANTIKILQGE